MPPVLVTGPQLEPLELEATKKFCKIEVPDDDQLVQTLITGVRVEVERLSGIAFGTSTWDQVLDAFPRPTRANPGAAIELPRWPAQSIGNVSYVDSAGQAQVLAPANYVLNAAARPPVLIPALGLSWPSERPLPGAGNVTVRFVAGFGADPAAIEPHVADLLDAMRMAVSEIYHNRETRIVGTIVAELPTLKAAIARYSLYPMGLR